MPTDKRTDPFRGFNFRVEIGGQIIGGFSEVSGLTADGDAVDYREGSDLPNNVRKLRQAAMMSKAELARRAGVSPLTIDRVESGCPCRMDTKRKILEALGLKPEAREQVFGPDIDQG